MQKAVKDALRRSALSYAEKHPDDISHRIATLEANIARLEQKREALEADGRTLSERALQTIEENKEELRCLRVVTELEG